MAATHTGKFIAYYRVSTAKQGKSGLGRKAQETAVHTYLNGDRWKLTAEFTEVESGKRSDRPQLAAALAACRLHRAKLVVAKVDRLTRSVAFLSALLESGVEVLFCDLPQMEGPTGRFMLQQMAAVAELEAGMISARTKAALAAAKARGVKLGGVRTSTVRDDVRELGQKAIQQRADARAADYAPGDPGAAGGRRNVAAGHRSGAQRARHSHAERPRRMASVQVQRVLARLP